MKRRIFRPAVVLSVITSLLITFFVPGLSLGLTLLDAAVTEISSSTEAGDSDGLTVRAEHHSTTAQFLLNYPYESVEDAEESELELKVKLLPALFALFTSLLLFSFGVYRLRFINFCKNYFPKLAPRLHSYHCVWVI